MDINEFRKQKDISVDEFANKLGISVSYSMQLNYGKRNLSIKILQKIKEVYPDVDMNIFFIPN